MIGVLDSGIGGLTVVRALQQHLPDRDIVYLGDTARAPYGSKSAETVTRYALESARFLVDLGAKVIVVASHSISAVAADKIRAAYGLPVFDVIGPTVRLALGASSDLRIGVIGTHRTVQSGAYEKQIRKQRADAQVFSTACPLLVPLVENGWLKKPETARIVKKYLLPLKLRQIDTLILGCTHYLLLKKTIQEKVGRRIRLVDPAAAVAAELHTSLTGSSRPFADTAAAGRLRLLVSDRTDLLANTVRQLLGRPHPLEATPPPL